MRRGKVRTFLRVIGVLILTAAVTVGAFLGTQRVRELAAATPEPTPLPTPTVYDAVRAPASSATPTTAPPIRPAALASAVAPRLADPRLGGRVLATVADAATGTVLLGRTPSLATSPASTVKLATGLAALQTLGPERRIVTRLLAAGPGTLVLVGGGDPTLTGAPAGRPGTYEHAARLTDLAARVTNRGAITRIVVDASLFAGPAVSPRWDDEDVPSDYGSAITALMVDGGRADPGDKIRSAEPHLDAGRALAALLGVPAEAVVAGRAPAGARELGRVQSAPVATLVEQMVKQSDNVIAECLGRLVAVAAARPASFDGAVAAVRASVATLGVTLPGPLYDASGLARAGRLSTNDLVALLRVAVTDATGRYFAVVEGLPVAAWDGTLFDRYTGPAAIGAGTVRAKTGTLTGVSALAGIVRDRSGRLLVFAVIADQVDAAGTDAAEAALDAVAAALSTCGCT